ncbi:MAG: hypothetical protein ACTSVB_05440 [Candidatus Heimdallarchaeaceae archaeon]
MIYWTFIKKNKIFWLNQIPQFVLLFSLVFLALIVKGSSIYRLTSFAEEEGPYDITGSFSISSLDEINAVEKWIERLNSERKSDISKYYQSFYSHVSLINSSIYIKYTEVSQIVKIISCKGLFSINNDEALIFGSLLQQSGFKDNAVINVSKMVSDGEKTASSFSLLRIIGIIEELPLSIKQTIGNYNYIFVNQLTFTKFFAPIIDKGCEINFIISYLFSESFKLTFDITERLDYFKNFTQSTLKSEYKSIHIEPPTIIWNSKQFEERIQTLFADIRRDTLFFIYTSLPLFLLLILLLYQFRFVNAAYFRNFIKKLHTRGYTQKKISRFFLINFLFLNSILGFICSLLLVLLFKETFVFSLINLLILTLFWVIFISFYHVYMIKKGFTAEEIQDSYKNKEYKTLRSDYFKIIIISLSTILSFVAIRILMSIFSFSLKYFLPIIAIILIVALSRTYPILDKLLHNFVRWVYRIVMTKLLRNYLKNTNIIIYKLYSQKNKHSLNVSSLLLIFIFLPSILIVNDSFTNKIYSDLYNQACGDILISETNSEVFDYLNEHLAVFEVLPIIKWTSDTNITFFFTRPTQLADFIRYTLSRASKYTSVDPQTIAILDNMLVNPYNIIISKQLADSFSLSINSTLSITKNENISLISHYESSLIEFTVYSIFDEFFQLFSETNYWVISWIGEENYSFPLLDEPYFYTPIISYPYFNRSLINTLMIKLENKKDTNILLSDLTNKFPGIKFTLMSTEEIDTFYPVPMIFFRYFLYLEIFSLLILHELFNIQSIAILTHSKRKAIVQLYSKGFLPKFLLVGALSFIICQFLTFVTIGIPLSFLLSSVSISLVSIISLEDKFNISITYFSAFLFACIMLTSILISCMLSVYNIQQIIKKPELIVSDENG